MSTLEPEFPDTRTLRVANMIIRQGDCLLLRCKTMPEGCVEIPAEGGRIVLMHGEVTGHAHAIYDHEASMEEAGCMAAKAIGESARRSKVRLMKAPDGIRYLEVFASVNLRHEEHTAHEIPPGIYELPIQVAEDTENGVRQIAD